MFAEEVLRSLAAELLALARADEAEVLLLGSDEALTRFAGNAVHQHVAERNLELRLRLVRGRRVGVATTNDLGPEALRAALARAEALADEQPPQADWPGLPAPEPIAPAPEPDEATVAATPEERVARVRPLCQAAASRGANASGALSTALRMVSVANSHGLWAHAAGSRAHWVSVVLAGSGAGYSEWTGRRLAGLDAGALGEAALAKALASQAPRELAPGRYPVVLEPYAVATLLSFLAQLGLSGQAVAEGRSFLNERLDQQVASPAVSLRDDWRHPDQLPLPFDFEGVPRQTVGCLVDGVARAAVWDRRSAARAGEGRRSTGHALPAPGHWGPLATHLVLDGGDSDLERMVAGMERGVYVTRFHYVRTVQPKQTVITGLTRDGTFLIEDGRLAGPVKNLRFTQSILEALSGVSAVGRELQPVGDWLGATLAPALALEAFQFTGSTSY